MPLHHIKCGEGLWFLSKFVPLWCLSKERQSVTKGDFNFVQGSFNLHLIKSVLFDTCIKMFWLRCKGCSLLTNGWYCRIFYPKGSVYFSWEILHELAKVSVFWEKVRYKWSKPVVNLKGPGTVAQLSGFCTLALHSSLGMGILFKKKPFFRHFGTQKSQLAFSGSKWFLGISWNVNFSQ